MLPRLEDNGSSQIHLCKRSQQSWALVLAEAREEMTASCTALRSRLRLAPFKQRVRSLILTHLIAMLATYDAGTRNCARVWNRKVACHEQAQVDVSSSAALTASNKGRMFDTNAEAGSAQHAT